MQFEDFLKFNSHKKHHAVLFVSKQFEHHDFPNDVFYQFAEKFCGIMSPRGSTAGSREIDPAVTPREPRGGTLERQGALQNFYHPDILIIDRERKQLRLEEIEKISKFCLHPAQIGTHRLIFIENCERLNLNSANFILKSLEEPAAKVVFLFTTAHRDLLLPTVLSRLQTIYVTFPNLVKKSFIELFEKEDKEFFEKTIFALSPQNIFFGKSLSDKKNFYSKPEHLAYLMTNCEQIAKKYTAEQLRCLIIYYVSKRLKQDNVFIVVVRFILAHLRAWQRAEPLNTSSYFWLLRIFLVTSECR